VRDTKDSIIKAARHLFAQHGYHGTSVDSIVKEAGVSKGSLYWHFSDKFELYRTILILEVERVKELLNLRLMMLSMQRRSFAEGKSDTRRF